MEIPVFITKQNIKNIENALLNGDFILDYKLCEGIDPEIYGTYKEMIIEHKSINKKIVEKNINKRLRKLFKNLEYIDGV